MIQFLFLVNRKMKPSLSSEKFTNETIAERLDRNYELSRDCLPPACLPTDLKVDIVKRAHKMKRTEMFREAAMRHLFVFDRRDASLFLNVRRTNLLEDSLLQVFYFYFIFSTWYRLFNLISKIYKWHNRYLCFNLSSIFVRSSVYCLSIKLNTRSLNIKNSWLFKVVFVIQNNSSLFFLSIFCILFLFICSFIHSFIHLVILLVVHLFICLVGWLIGRLID